MQIAELLTGQIAKSRMAVKRVIMMHTIFYTINIEIGKWDKPHVKVEV